MNDEIDVYLRGVLPLLDEEKVSQLLSKGSHVVDKVYDIAQTDERLKGVIQSIYDAGTNICLANKMDGNKTLMDAGLTNFADFYFNCEAKQEDLVKLADPDVITNNDPTPYWKKVVDNLPWNVPAEHIFTLFSGFVFSVLNDMSLPGNTSKLEGTYNYLRFQLERAGVSVFDMPEYHKKIEARLPNVLDVTLAGVANRKAENLVDALKSFSDKRDARVGSLCITGSMMSFSGTISNYSPRSGTYI